MCYSPKERSVKMRTSIKRLSRENLEFLLFTKVLENDKDKNGLEIEQLENELRARGISNLELNYHFLKDWLLPIFTIISEELEKEFSTKRHKKEV